MNMGGRPIELGGPCLPAVVDPAPSGVEGLVEALGILGCDLLQHPGRILELGVDLECLLVGCNREFAVTSLEVGLGEAVEGVGRLRKEFGIHFEGLDCLCQLSATELTVPAPIDFIATLSEVRTAMLLQ